MKASFRDVIEVLKYNEDEILECPIPSIFTGSRIVKVSCADILSVIEFYQRQYKDLCAQRKEFKKKLLEMHYKIVELESNGQTKSIVDILREKYGLEIKESDIYE